MSDINAYRIIYHMYPCDDVTIVIYAHNEEEAIMCAKEYRNDSFSIIEINGVRHE